jgi:class 3 adenylate cyclase
VIGFGVGLAMGQATVGQIGYESRLEYTAIGNVVNLASRLCSSAKDGEIIIDCTSAEAVAARIGPEALGTRKLKGYDKEVLVYGVDFRKVAELQLAFDQHNARASRPDEVRRFA